MCEPGQQAACTLSAWLGQRAQQQASGQGATYAQQPTSPTRPPAPAHLLHVDGDVQLLQHVPDRARREDEAYTRRQGRSPVSAESAADTPVQQTGSSRTSPTRVNIQPTLPALSAPTHPPTHPGTWCRPPRGPAGTR